MRDLDVRMAVHKKVLKNKHCDPNTLIIDEFSLNLGASRADIAVINGIIHGYELKSKKDNLKRLPSQVFHYSEVMDKATLIVDESHYGDAVEILPKWWGVKVIIQGSRGGLHLENVRSSSLNYNQNSHALAKLLWRDECLIVLNKLNLLKGNKSKPRYELWDIVGESAPLSFLREEVRQMLKMRKDWRAME